VPLTPTADTAWCERLYDESGARLLLYGRALGLSHSEAEDVLQDTFLALLRLPQAPAHPAHYLRRSFRNRARNTWRGLWRRLAREAESRHWFEPEPEATASERAVVHALANLPVPQREVIVLKIWHQLTFHEIGALVGVSPHTAAGRYRYGLQKLRALAAQTHYELAEPDREAVAWMAAASALPEA
jgi:RNA polymerase sigma-70 factor (ECF subfamily)